MFFCIEPATTEIYTYSHILSLHDALPIATGMQFASDSHVITGDQLTLNGPQSTIRVGDGTLAGLGYTATIAADQHEPGAELRQLDERSEEHTSELQSLMRISYAVFCLKKKTHIITAHFSQTLYI